MEFTEALETILRSFIGRWFRDVIGKYFVHCLENIPQTSNVLHRYVCEDELIRDFDSADSDQTQYTSPAVNISGPTQASYCDAILVGR